MRRSRSMRDLTFDREPKESWRPRRRARGGALSGLSSSSSPELFSSQAGSRLGRPPAEMGRGLPPEDAYFGDGSSAAMSSIGRGPCRT